MKKCFVCAIVLFSLYNVLYAGNLRFLRSYFPEVVIIDDTAHCRVEYENINTMYAVQSIKYNISVTQFDGSDTLFYKEVEAPDLLPNKSTTIDFGPLDYTKFSDGNKYRITFNTSQVFDEDPTNNIGYRDFEIYPAFDRLYALDKIQSYFNTNFSEDELKYAQAYLGINPLKAGTKISSYDGKYSDTLKKDSWLFFTDWNIFSMYEKPVSYMILEKDNPEIATYNTSWFPRIDGEIWHPSIIDKEQIAYGTIFNNIPDLTTNIDFNLPVPEKKDSICVLIVSGYPADESEQEAFNRSRKLIRWYFQENENGEQLGDDNIHELAEASAYDIKEAINKMKDSCTKIYVYYNGHALEDGKLCTNDPQEDWLSYNDLFKSLYGTNADEITVILDACYSSKAIAVAKSVTKKPGTNVHIFTSSDSTKPSKFLFWKDPKDSNDIDGAGFFTKKFVHASLDTNANKNKDTIISVEEVFDHLRSTNPKHSVIDSNINELQNPQKAEIKASADKKVARIKELTKPIYDMNPQYISVYYDPTPIPTTWKFYPSYNPTQEITHNDTVYTGWIDMNNRARFEHPTILFTYNPKTEEYKTQESMWYPVILDNNNISFTEDVVLWGKDRDEIFTIGEKENTISETTTDVSNEKVCVLLVSGLDKKYPDQQEAFENDVEDVKNELMNEKMGLKVNEDDIRVEKGIDKDSIIAILRSMKDKCDKVIFYYSGHGSTSGDICTGDNTEDMNSFDDWTSYEDLMDGLDEIGAKDYVIIIDACYSGKAKDAFDNHFEDADATIITATDKEKQANTEAKGTSKEDADKYAIFTHYLLLCYGNKDADANNDGIVSFEEAFNCVKKMKPKTVFGEDLDSLQKPTITIKENGIANTTDKEVSFPNSDLKILNVDGSELDYKYSVILSVGDNSYTTKNDKIKELSGSRTWTINTTAPEKSINIDLQFQLREQYLKLSPSGADIIGMCWRENSTQDWEPQYPSLYNKDDKTLLCGKTDHLSDWVVGIIDVEGNSNVDSQFLINNVEYGPNPFKNLLNFEFNLDKPETFAIEIVDITGKLYDKINQRDYAIGHYSVNLDGSKYPSGTYYCRLISSEGIRTIKLVKE